MRIRKKCPKSLFDSGPAYDGKTKNKLLKIFNIFSCIFYFHPLISTIHFSKPPPLGLSTPPSFSVSPFYQAASLPHSYPLESRPIYPPKLEHQRRWGGVLTSCIPRRNQEAVNSIAQQWALIRAAAAALSSCVTHGERSSGGGPPLPVRFIYRTSYIGPEIINELCPSARQLYLPLAR